MALSTLFSRRPAPPATPLVVEPEAWPETGETWTPDGVTVLERYYNLSHAVVLVHRSSYHMVSCLGCHYTATQRSAHSSSILTLEQAADLANAHAGSCRALPREIPARPDDQAARDLLHTLVHGMRKPDDAVRLHLAQLDTQRLVLQRTNDWIVAELKRLADDDPEVLKVSVNDWGTAFFLQQKCPVTGPSSYDSADRSGQRRTTASSGS